MVVDVAIKVVIRLSVNRLPVKLPVSIFDYRLSIYRHFSSRRPNAIFGLRLTQSHRRTKTLDIGPRHTDAVRRQLGPVGSFDCQSAPLPSPRRAG